jgi:hypothetical protein
VARCSACPSQVFQLNKQVPNSVDVVIQRQCVAIVDTRAPAFATRTTIHLRLASRSRIFLVGRHQGVCRLISLGLHCIKSIGSCRMLHRGRTLSPTTNMILCGPCASQVTIHYNQWIGVVRNDGGERAMVNTVRRFGDGHAFQQGYLRYH